MERRPVQKCKGARDLLPEDLKVFRHIEDVFRQSCSAWGYKEVRTPTLEYLHLFTSVGMLTPSMLGRVYSFLDWNGWSGERVVLRPDGTIPVARLYVENAPKWDVARLFYVTNVFAFEETGVENRERWQCGAELIGSATPGADVETIMLAVEVLQNLKLNNFEIKLSHAGVLRALIKELKLDPEVEAKLLDEILDGDWEALRRVEPPPGIIELLSLILDSKGTNVAFIKNLKSLPKLPESVDLALGSFAKVVELLDAVDIRYQIDITSVRGFEYYTGMCFQFFCKGEKIGSGGRYDNLIPLVGGMITPACGFALYMDPLMGLVIPEEKGEEEKKVMIQCEAENSDAIRAAFEVAKVLRYQGYPVEFSFTKIKAGAAYRWLVQVTSKPVGFVVLDRVRDRKKKVGSFEQVVDVIGGTS